MPEALKPPAAEKLTLESFARGVQIYECAVAKDPPGRLEWIFKAPEAELFDTAGKRIGKHYAGPTWESEDGSRVVAAVKARDDAPQAGAIPWLLLGAKSNAGTGTFGRTTNIQRAGTAGGVAPAASCGKAGEVARVPYTATYYFYAPK